MKRIPIIAIILTAALIVAVILVARDAHSETPLERNSVEVNTFLTATIPAYPDVEPITAQAYRAPFVYWTSGEASKALIRGEDLPRMIYASTDFHGDIATLTIVIEGVPGTTATLDWTSYPTVKLSPVELRLKAYTQDYVELKEDKRPIVDIILSDVTMTTEEVCVGGWCDKGYLDAEKLEAQVVFKATLPEADYAPYKKWLAGQSILGALRIQIPNPFAK